MSKKEIDFNKRLKTKPIIELKELEKNFGSKDVLKSIDLKIYEGEFITILGPSGSGKSTILSLLGGFEYPTRGEIVIQGKDVKDLSPNKRPTSTIFQDYALFPHLDVAGNVSYGLKLIRKPVDSLVEKMQPKLVKLKEQWKAKAKLEMNKLDKIQAEYIAKLEKFEKSDKNSKLLNKKEHAKIQKWLDDSDFKYSHWENYVSLKTESFTHRHMSRALTKKEIDKRVELMLQLVGLEGNGKENINNLSGGMKQRVALARSLAIRPKILLLDEPLSALDAKIRTQMQKLLVSLQEELNLTFVFVTHDQKEALELSSRIIVVRNGKIEQFDLPEKIYDYPKNKWVANFIGESNFFEGIFRGDYQIEFLGKTFRTIQNEFEIGQKLDVLIRPEDISISLSRGAFSGTVQDWTYKGSYYITEVKITEEKTLLVESTEFYDINTKVYLNWDIDDIHLMQQENLVGNQNG
ncbi:spermidine/putrescine ABC transporter ATP-binding protein [Mycoplasma testudineum]|nr:ABC transporter ATP-binding protein [Mycoplasma testudineum]OYD26639.1 spermidine/putrescine ABC transporter ATP-binding protein [Mycoplasma testudineum]